MSTHISAHMSTHTYLHSADHMSLVERNAMLDAALGQLRGNGQACECVSAHDDSSRVVRKLEQRLADAEVTQRFVTRMPAHMHAHMHQGHTDVQTHRCTDVQAQCERATVAEQCAVDERDGMALTNKMLDGELKKCRRQAKQLEADNLRVIELCDTLRTGVTDDAELRSRLFELETLNHRLVYPLPSRHSRTASHTNRHPPQAPSQASATGIRHRHPPQALAVFGSIY